jgi:hypothetical protein
MGVSRPRPRAPAVLFGASASRRKRSSSPRPPRCPLWTKPESADRSRADSCSGLGMRESPAPPAVRPQLVHCRSHGGSRRRYRSCPRAVIRRLGGRRDSNAPGAIASCGCAETSAARPFREPATRLHPCDGGSGGLSVWGGSLDDCRPVGARCTARFVQWQAEALRCCSVVSWWAGAASDESEALALSTREEGPVGNGRR